MSRLGQHVYQPPKGNRALRYLIPILGSLIFTFLVFYVIPLMKKLDGGAPKKTVAYDPGITVEAPPEFTPEEEPPPEAEPEEQPELAPEPLDLNLSVDIPLSGLGTGGIQIEINPGFAIDGAGEDFANSDLNEPPRVRTRARPIYPTALKKKGITGRVVVTATVDEKGQVENAVTKESSGFPSMDRAAEKSVLRYKFKPAIKAGRPARSTAMVPINFKLRQKKS